MTAQVDHAELKRLADALRVSWSDRGWTPAKKIDGLLKEARQAADAMDALLSEIEGLKAERDGYQPDGAELPTWSELAEYWRDRALRTQAPDSWRPDREAVARELSPDEWALYDRTVKAMGNRSRRVDEAILDLCKHSLAKADAILALRPQTAESGK